MRVCLVCDRNRPTYRFYPGRQVCRDCAREQHLADQIASGNIDGKRCNTCHRLKPLTDFYARYAKCKLCKRAVSKKDRAAG